MRCFPVLTIIAILFACNSLVAQKKSTRGYYITYQGDTIKGEFPKYIQWNKSPSHVEFIVEGTKSQINLIPQTISKFAVEGYDEYVSYTGSRLINPIEDAVVLDETSYVGFNDSLLQTITFLRLVKRTSGINLYLLKDAKRINFFFQLPGQPLTELRYKKRLVDGRIIEIADYKQQLNQLFAKTIAEKKLLRSFETLSYNEEELSSFFQDLFPNTLQERKKRYGSKEWIVSAGAVLNMVEVEVEDRYSSIPQHYTSSYSPLLSVGVMIPFSRNFGRYFFYPQVKLFQYKNSGEGNQSTYINAVTYSADLVVITQAGVGINVVNRESHRLFITSGLGLMGQFGAKQVKQLYSSPDRVPYMKANEIELPKLTYSIDASVGAVLNKKVMLVATYKAPTTISNFVLYEAKLSGIQLSVGYKL